jgi:hypothetical protein
MIVTRVIKFLSEAGEKHMQLGSEKGNTNTHGMILLRLESQRHSWFFSGDSRQASSDYSGRDWDSKVLTFDADAGAGAISFSFCRAARAARCAAKRSTAD